MNTKNKDYISLALWIMSLIAIGSIIGYLTKGSISGWYGTLNRSPLTPPNYVFSIVWSILYAMIATSGWLIWNSKNFPQLELIKKLYIFQLILNWSWMPLFFGYQLINIALMCLSALTILVALLIAQTYKKITTASLLLVPYLLWLLFATYLNFYICHNN